MKPFIPSTMHSVYGTSLSSETIRVLNDPNDRYIICQTHGSSDMRKTTFVKDCPMNQQTIQTAPFSYTGMVGY